jgi:hypothetical protein
MPNGDLEKHVDFFGHPMTMRALPIHMGGRLGEHLGQSIANARINHIVPPWSQKKGVIGGRQFRLWGSWHPARRLQVETLCSGSLVISR